jgi:hypothetical protein
MKVVDHSNAQKKGYIMAFADVALEQPGETRSKAELVKIARNFLKGCEFHFDEAVRRVASVSEFVPSLSKDEFLTCIDLLKTTETVKDFKKMAARIHKQWPGIVGWIEYWERPENARMIFKAYRSMDQSLWDSMPNTTNAEEAQHFWIAQAVGTRLGFIEGLEGLARVAEYYTSRVEAAQGV